ncbi:MAG: acyltransferase family protein [Acutalibacteraceae bacterium]
MLDKKRIVWIDQLKGVAFMFVILGHLSIDNTFCSWIYSFHMPLFFFVSGFNLNVEKIQQTPFWQYVYKLFKRLVIPYFWIELLCLCFSYLTNIITTHKEVNVPENLLGILIGNGLIKPYPSRPLYFALVLFLSQILLCLICKAAKKLSGGYGTILLLSAALITLGLATEGKAMVWRVNVVPLATFLIFFGRLMMDCYLANKQKLEKLNIFWYLALIVGFFAVGFVLWKINGRISIAGNKYGEDTLLLLLCSASTTCALALAVMKIPKIGLLSYVGMNTYFFMGVHKPIIILLERLFSEYKKEAWFIAAAAVGIYLILIPMTYVAKKLFPYICGEKFAENTRIIKLGKVLAVIGSTCVTYNYFLNHFKDGILKQSAGGIIIAVAAYAIAVAAFLLVFEKLTPFVYLQERKTKKSS